MKAFDRLNKKNLVFNHKVLKEKKQVSQTTIKGLKKENRSSKKVLGPLKKCLRLLKRSTQKIIKL